MASCRGRRWDASYLHLPCGWKQMSCTWDKQDLKPTAAGHSTTKCMAARSHEPTCIAGAGQINALMLLGCSWTHLSETPSFRRTCTEWLQRQATQGSSWCSCSMAGFIRPEHGCLEELRWRIAEWRIGMCQLVVMHHMQNQLHGIGLLGLGNAGWHKQAGGSH